MVITFCNFDETADKGTVIAFLKDTKKLDGTASEVPEEDGEAYLAQIRKTQTGAKVPGTFVMDKLGDREADFKNFQQEKASVGIACNNLSYVSYR